MIVWHYNTQLQSTTDQLKFRKETVDWPTDAGRD